METVIASKSTKTEKFEKVEKAVKVEKKVAGIGKVRGKKISSMNLENIAAEIKGEITKTFESQLEDLMTFKISEDVGDARDARDVKDAVDVKDTTKDKNTEKFDYTKDTWETIDAYFAQNNNKQIVKHQLESFQQFMDFQLWQTIKQFNPVVIYHDYNAEANKHRVELHLEFSDFSIDKPIIHENDGSFQQMTPAIARLRHLTYASQLSINIHLRRIIRSGDNLEKEDVDTLILNKTNFGKIPIMVHSKYCMLNNEANIYNNNPNEKECKYDLGGYFIIGGNEKVIISQERIAENKIFVFNNQRQTKSIDAEIKAMPDYQFGLAMCNYVKYVFKTEELMVEAPNFKTGINLFVMARALGISTDKDLVSLIVWNVECDRMEELMFYIKKTLEAYKVICSENGIVSMITAREYISKFVNFKGNNKEIKITPTSRVEYLVRSFTNELLPQMRLQEDIGEGNEGLFVRKAHFLGYMAQRVLRVYLGYTPYDDRDSYQNKRVDNPGVLIVSYFRQCFNRLMKDIKKSILKELKSNKSGKDVFEIINVNNIYKIVKPTLIEGGLKYALATGNFSVKNASGGTQKSKVGTAQVLNRLAHHSYISHLRRINSPSEKNNGKLVAPRKLHWSQWGYICTAETPEGGPVGLVKNMALTCQITVNANSTPVRIWLKENGLVMYPNFKLSECLDSAKIFVNGDWIGIHKNPRSLVYDFKEARRRSQFNIYNSIYWDVISNDICIYTDYGRVSRPLYIVNSNHLAITKDNINHLKTLPSGQRWNYLLMPASNVSGISKGGISNTQAAVVEFIDCEEVHNTLIATSTKTLIETYEPYIRNFTHCEIHPGLILGAVGCVVPFPDHNQSPRNTYQSAMSKQALGVYSTNFQQRMDTHGYVMNTIERPIVSNKFGRYVGYDGLPNGLNCVIAIASYSGYNQEDSLIINQHALDRGLFRATIYHTYKDEEKKIQSSGKEEKFTLPDAKSKYIINKKPGDYSKLDERGFIKKDVYVDSSDIIIGKILPLKQKSATGAQLYKDCSTTLRVNETGFIDKVYVGRNGEGVRFCNVRIRSERIPKIGDKFASRCGQKGTCGITYPQHQMPFNKDGISPDAIMNPHAIPSRMTIGQLLECILGKTAATLGGIADCTPFSEIDPDKVGNILEDLGFNRCGNEVLYNGMTGEQMHVDIFMGPTFYQRLKHMVDDKVHSRSRGPVVQMTRQPAEGRSRDGGLRFGEMERDCLMGNTPISVGKGLSYQIENFERLRSDVLGWNEDKEGMVISKQTEFLYKGERECVDVYLEDGRKLTCTPEHKLLSGLNEWTKANELKAGEDYLKCSVKYPTINIDEEMEVCKDWSLRLSNEFIIETNTIEGYFKSLAFARIIAYLMTDGYIGLKKNSYYGRIYLGHQLDVERLLDDIKLFTPITQTNFISKNIYMVNVPLYLIRNIVKVEGIMIGAKVSQPSVLPAFILDPECPVPIVREFLAGLFGGDGHTCYIGKNTFTSISFSKSKNVALLDSLKTMMENVKELLNRCGIHEITIQMPKVNSASKTRVDERKNYEIVLHLDIFELISFHEKIGFRYCCHKNQRLEAAVSYMRLRSNVIRQKVWIINRVDELTNYKQIKTATPGKIVATSAAIKQATDELNAAEPILHSFAIPNQHDILEYLINERSGGKIPSSKFETSTQFLKRIGALEWFNEPVKKMIKIKEMVEEVGEEVVEEVVEPKEDTDDIKNFGVVKTQDFLPTMNLKVIAVRPGGIHKVYDIQVENEASFLANGVVAHNCMIAHGTLGFLKEKTMDVSDLFEIYICRECGLFADINPEKDIYKCSGCVNSSDFARLEIPYACKLLLQELQGMALAPRIRFNLALQS